MKIEGKEKELREHFSKLEKRQRKRKPLSPEAKSWIFALAWLGILVFLGYLAYTALVSYNQLLTPDQCQTKINTAVLESHANGFWQEMLAKYSYLLPLLAIAIGIGWAIHGVGFRII